MTYKNYTVVGSPTITDDGIASGFGRSNYIYLPSVLPTEAGHNYIFKTRYKHITNNFSDTGYIFDIATTRGDYFGVTTRFSTKTISFVNCITSSAIFSDTVALVEGKTYDIEYHTDFSTYVKYYVDGDLKEFLTYSATGYPTTGNVLIGIAIGPGLPLTCGQIDLNAFKIYVDENIIHQPYNSDFKLINRIYTRHDTASNFSTNNPILGAGELAIATDTHTLKAGDGTTAYNSLPEYVKTTGDQTISGYKTFQAGVTCNSYLATPSLEVTNGSNNSAEAAHLDFLRGVVIGDNNSNYPLILSGNTTRPKYDDCSNRYQTVTTDLALYSDIPDVSNYYTKTEVDAELAAKQDELTFGNGWQTPSSMTGPQQYGYIVTESSYTANAGWHCFNGKWDVSEEGWWSGNNPGPWWVKIELPEAGVPTEWVIKNEIASPSNFKDGKLQGSNDNSTWDDLYVITDRPDTTGYIETYMLSTNTAYKYLRIYVTDTYGGTVSIQQMSIKGKYVSGGLTTDALANGTGIGFNNKKLTYNIIGKPIIVNNVMSNTSGSNYLITDLSPNGQPWEIKAKVTTGSSLGNLKFITGNSGTDSDIHGPAFGIDGDRWAMSLSSSPGGNYDIGNLIKGSYVPLTNTTYYLKFGWTGTLYYIDYSLDGETYTRDSTRESSLSIQNGNMLIGNSIPGSGYSWNGTIDLNEFYINNVPACATTNDIAIEFDPTTIPGYSASGTYTLKLVDGIVQWVLA